MDEVAAGAGQVPWWVRVADALTLSLVVLAVVVLFTGGFRTTVGGLLLSIRSESRVAFWALGVGLLRRLAYRKVTLFSRVSGSRPVVRLRRLLGVSQLIVPDAAPWFAPDDPTPRGWRPAAEYLAVFIVMTVLTILVTYPQIVSLDKVRDQGDPLFSVWRLAWIAHQLPRDPGHLFDANIFYPARDTLALSDSILLPGLVAAPFIWLGASPVRVYNLWFMATFVLSALAMYALVRALTGHRGAALVAAVAFAFYPFRFERYSTFEMQLSFWMPLALLAVHRAMATGRRRWGLLAGLAFAAQVYSCMYFAAFLVVFLVPLCFVLAWARGHLVRRLSPLLPGALLAAALIFPLALAYVSAREQFGGRDLGEVTYFSATAARYLVPSAANATWTTLWPDSARLAERDLFPGALIVVLALVAVWPPLSRSRAAYAVALLVAFDASLGVHGHVYPWLYGYAAPFRSIRVPARFSMLVGMALAVLAGYGAARVAGRPKSRAAAWVLVAAMCATVCVESRPVLAFQEPCRLHAIYSWFHGRPTSVIAELPAPGRVAERLFEDVRYQYWSTFHWNKLVNGYSGILPRMYLTFSAQMTEFPDDASLAVLKQRGVEYVVVHEEFYDDRALYRRVVGASARRADLVEAARAVDRGTEARIYRVVR